MPMIDKFHEDKNMFVFLISTLAGGTGLNLTGANKVVVFGTFSLFDFTDSNNSRRRAFFAWLLQIRTGVSSPSDFPLPPFDGVLIMRLPSTSAFILQIPHTIFRRWTEPIALAKRVTSTSTAFLAPVRSRS